MEVMASITAQRGTVSGARPKNRGQSPLPPFAQGQARTGSTGHCLRPPSPLTTSALRAAAQCGHLRSPQKRGREQGEEILLDQMSADPHTSSWEGASRHSPKVKCPEEPSPLGGSGIRRSPRHRGSAPWGPGRPSPGSHGHTGHGVRQMWVSARLAQGLCVPTTRPAKNSGKQTGLERSGEQWIPSPSDPPGQRPGPSPGQAAPGLTDGQQDGAVPLVEVGPGFGLAALAAGEDAVAAHTGHQAHPHGAATLRAEPEEGDPARGTRLSGVVPSVPASSAWAAAHTWTGPQVPSRDSSIGPLRTGTKHGAQGAPRGGHRGWKEAVRPRTDRAGRGLLRGGGSSSYERTHPGLCGAPNTRTPHLRRKVSPEGPTAPAACPAPPPRPRAHWAGMV